MTEPTTQTNQPQQIKWHFEKRKISDLIPASYNPRNPAKICAQCGKLYYDRLYQPKRKYCSRACWSKICSLNLGEWTKSENIAERNKLPYIRQKVSEGLKRYYAKHIYGRLSRKGDFDYGWTGWKNIRANIISRDVLCQSCGSNKSLRVHHIIPVRSDGSNKQNNLIVLCNKCHQRIEKNQLGIFNIVKNWEIVRILMLDSLLERRLRIARIRMANRKT